MEDAVEVDPQWGGGYHDQSLHSCQPRDLVLESVQEDGEAAGQVALETVSKVSHNLTHAGDGSLLHLLVNILCLKTKN